MKSSVFKKILPLFAMLAMQPLAVAESEFDTYLKTRGGLLQPTFEQLTSDFAKFSERQATGVHIPKGRSPEAAQSSPKFPRTVVTFKKEPLEPFDLSFVRGARTFLATVDGTEEYQIISWDADAQPPQFQFRRIQRLGLTNSFFPRLIKKNECTTCHQDGLPIFSAAPWSESSQNAVTSSQLQEALPGKKLCTGFPSRVEMPQTLLIPQFKAQVGSDKRPWPAQKLAEGISFAERLSCSRQFA